MKMEIAKSLFQVRDHEGYVGKEDHNVSSYLYLFKHLSLYLNLFNV